MEGAATGMEWITTGAENVLSIFDTLLNTITSNPLLGMLFVGGTIIPLGFMIFKKFKHA